MNRKLISSSGLIFALCLFVGINIIANGLFTSWRLDVTENRLFTLSDGTRNILAQLEEPITLRFYFSRTMFTGIPSLLNYGMRVRDMLEEYANNAGGRINLVITDPEPFSETEDEAVAYGIRQLPLGSSGELAYFGLAGSNSTDDEMTIPFFEAANEQSLEYEISKMIYHLAHPKKRVIGIVSSLPVLGALPGPGGPDGEEQWAVFDFIREEFEVRDLGTQFSAIAEDIDTLMIVHPKSLSDEIMYLIDQFVLKGGKAMIFVDPLSEGDTSQPDPQNPMAMPQRYSDLALLKKWGINYDPEKVAGDLDAAIRVGYAGERGQREIEYIPWLRLEPKNFNRDDFVTNQLSVINVGSSGHLEKAEDSPIQFIPLIKTGKHAMAYERDSLIFVRDPAGLLNSFQSADREFTLAARITGKLKSAYPEGKPGNGEAAQGGKDDAFVAESAEPVNLLVFADTDILSDRFWVQFQNFLGLRVPSPHADNANLVINALDNLGGSHDLISLRSRNEYARPFKRVEAIQRDAEAKFRAEEQTLKNKLADTEAKLQELQQKNDEGKGLLLSAEQRETINKFRAEQIQTRKALRDVQHNLRKDIERLGSALKFINIGLIPLLFIGFAVGFAILKSKRQGAVA